MHAAFGQKGSQAESVAFCAFLAFVNLCSLALGALSIAWMHSVVRPFDFPPSLSIMAMLGYIPVYLWLSNRYKAVSDTLADIAMDRWPAIRISAVYFAVTFLLFFLSLELFSRARV